MNPFSLFPNSLKYLSRHRLVTTYVSWLIAEVVIALILLVHSCLDQIGMELLEARVAKLNKMVMNMDGQLTNIAHLLQSITSSIATL